jgi:hypothetical protein
VHAHSHGLELLFLRPDRIEQLRAGNEHHAGRQGGEHPTHIAGVDLQIMAAAFDRAHGDGEDDQIRLEASLDREQPGDPLTHRHG